MRQGIVISLLCLSIWSLTFGEVYQIGGISVDTDRRELKLEGRVKKDSGWVQFLFYADGYKWLKEESAFILDAELESLQQAIAAVDWQLWQLLWDKRERDVGISVEVSWNEKVRVNPRELILGEEAISFVDLIFLGSPYFDSIVLGINIPVPCLSCPLLSLEQEALRKQFKRPSGKSGYRLNKAKMPPVGTKVTVTIRIPDA